MKKIRKEKRRELGEEITILRFSMGAKGDS